MMSVVWLSGNRVQELAVRWGLIHVDAVLPLSAGSELEQLSVLLSLDVACHAVFVFLILPA
jgi:hypothetical protein